MSQSVFIKAWLRTTKGDLDISDSIESIRHESDKEKGDLVEFKVKTDKGLDIANHSNMVAGAVVVYTFGFLKSWNQSPVKLCRVSDIRYDLSQKRVQLLIQAVDKSLEIKKAKSYRVWKNKTLSEMCEEIATDYGLTFRYETTTVTKYTSMPQAGRSDWEFLNYVRLLESENYYISVDGVFLTLEKNMRSKDSAITYTFGENIISARIDLKEISQKQPVTGGLGLDDKTGKPYPNETESSPTTEKEKTDGKFSVNTIAKTAINQGKKIFDFDINSKKIGEHVENFLGSNPTESKNKASHINREQAEKVLTCDISIELDVHRKAGEVVTLNLPIDKLSGNWLVEKSVHIIDKNGGYTELSLSKTGTNRPIKASKEVNDAKVNSTEGGAKSGAKRRLFNVNGKEITKQ